MEIHSQTSDEASLLTISMTTDPVLTLPSNRSLLPESVESKYSLDGVRQLNRSSDVVVRTLESRKINCGYLEISMISLTPEHTHTNTIKNILSSKNVSKQQLELFYTTKMCSTRCRLSLNSVSYLKPLKWTKPFANFNMLILIIILNIKSKWYTLIAYLLYFVIGFYFKNSNLYSWYFIYPLNEWMPIYWNNYRQKCQNQSSHSYVPIGNDKKHVITQLSTKLDNLKHTDLNHWFKWWFVKEKIEITDST